MAHGAQRLLENAMLNGSSKVAKLLDEMIRKFSGPSDNAKGSLARALKCPKLAALFRKCQREDMDKLVSITGQLTSTCTNFAAHRWDSMLTACRLMCMNISPILQMLCTVAAGDKEHGSEWALDMLKARFLLDRNTFSTMRTTVSPFPMAFVLLSLSLGVDFRQHPSLGPGDRVLISSRELRAWLGQQRWNARWR